MAEDRNTPERPRVEPEIIPPDRNRGSAWPPYGFDPRTAHRIHIARVGPLGIVLLMLAVAFVIAVVLLILIGAVLLWLPFVVAVLVVAAFSGLFRRRRRT